MSAPPRPSLLSLDTDSGTLPTLDELEAASALVHEVMPPTPQRRWPLLEQRLGFDAAGGELWVKHEQHAPTGAFKVRGGIVYFAALAARGGVPGVVTATRGNHGQSVGMAAARHGIPAVVVVPVGNGVEKNAAMRALGVELIERGHDFQAAGEAADAIARERGWHRMPSLHRLLVAGVASYALELFGEVPGLERVYVPIGMGSGACGVIAVRDALGSRAEVVGVVSAHAPAYARSIASGRAESHDATTELADGMACRTPDPKALRIFARALARVAEVTDTEVAAAMVALFEDTHQVAEGSGAAALAALMQEVGARPEIASRRVAVIATGANVDRAVFARVLTS